MKYCAIKIKDSLIKNYYNKLLGLTFFYYAW